MINQSPLYKYEDYSQQILSLLLQSGALGVLLHRGIVNNDMAGRCTPHPNRSYETQCTSYT